MQSNGKRPLIVRVWLFYVHGFKDLSSWGRSVWLIILIKVFIMFAVIRLFFMPDVLKKNFPTDEQRSKHVLENLTTPNL